MEEKSLTFDADVEYMSEKYKTKDEELWDVIIPNEVLDRQAKKMAEKDYDLWQS